MAMARSDRFNLKSEILDELSKNNQKWTLQKMNVLLSEYGCPTLSGYDDFGFEDAIAGLDDSGLVEIYGIICGKVASGIDPRETLESSLGETPIWKPGMLRMFLSHSAKHKAFASQVAHELAPLGICGFVAHDSMTYDHDWQDQILLGLESMEACVVLLHPEVNDSPWCNQEIGWAKGSGTPFYLVRLGVDPVGFIGRTQYPQVMPENARQVALQIFQWVSLKDEFSEPLINGLLSALESADSYYESIAATKTLVQIAALTDPQWGRLDKAFISNDQVSGSSEVCRNLAPFYRENSRSWPPREPAVPVAL